ncbi:MAG: hypothetical protein Q9195_007513 [Heterodermia aff. obscurata]
MALSHSIYNNEGRSSAVTAPTTYDPYMTDYIHPEQSMSAIRKTVTDFNIPSWLDEGVEFAPSRSIYGSGPYSTSPTPLNLNQSHDAILVEQAFTTSPFSSPPEYGNLTSNLVWDPSFDPSANIAFPSYQLGNNGQYDPNGYTNVSYGNYNGGPYEHTDAHRQPTTIVIQKQTSRPSSKPHSCPFGCGSAFTRRTDMERHSKVHEPLNLWCRCGKGFYRKDKLKEHMKTHQKN